MSSLFSKIIAGDIPGAFVAQEEHWVAILDRFPSAPGHLLLIPRHEAPLLAQLASEAPQAAANMGDIIGRGCDCLYAALNCDAVSVLIRDGAAAGQEIPHVHIHLIPRFAAEGKSHHFSSGSYGANDEAINQAMAEMAKKLITYWSTQESAP